MRASDRSRWSLDVGRLVELDLAFLGPRVIVAEFAIGVVGCLALGAASLAFAVRSGAPVRSWPVLLGLELAAVGLNYIPLLLGAWRRRGDADGIAETRLALRRAPAEARSYGLRQAWILVPGAVLAFSFSQRGRREA